MHQTRLNVYLLCTILYLVVAIATFFVLGSSIVKYIIVAVELFAFIVFVFIWYKNHSFHNIL